MNRCEFIGRVALCAAAGLWIGGAFADGRIVAVDQAPTGLDGLSFEVPKARPCDALSKDGLKGLWLEGEP